MRAGETGGIVVARLDRFARSAVDALESIKRLNEAGARLVVVEDNFDGSTAMGRFAIGILTLIAELELERITENWDTAVGEAVEARRAYLGAGAGRLPQAGKSRGLRRAEPAPPRCGGVSATRGWRLLDRARRLLSSSRACSLDRQPALVADWGRQPVKNRVYLGEARSGKYVNPNAHEPIVTQAEFDAAQAARTVLPAPELSLSSEALLEGSCALRGLWAHAQDRRQPRQEARPAGAELLLPRPLREGPLPGARLDLRRQARPLRGGTTARRLARRGRPACAQQPSFGTDRGGAARSRGGRARARALPGNRPDRGRRPRGFLQGVEAANDGSTRRAATLPRFGARARSRKSYQAATCSPPGPTDHPGEAHAPSRAARPGRRSPLRRRNKTRRRLRARTQIVLRGNVSRSNLSLTTTTV